MPRVSDEDSVSESLAYRNQDTSPPLEINETSCRLEFDEVLLRHKLPADIAAKIREARAASKFMETLKSGVNKTI